MKLDILRKAGSALKVVAFRAREVRPEIMLGVGITTVLAGTVLACVKTKEAEPVVEHAKEQLDELDYIRMSATADERPDYREYVRVCYRAGRDLVKIYALPAAFCKNSHWESWPNSVPNSVVSKHRQVAENQLDSKVYHPYFPEDKRTAASKYPQPSMSLQCCLPIPTNPGLYPFSRKVWTYRDCQYRLYLARR